MTIRYLTVVFVSYARFLASLVVYQRALLIAIAAVMLVQVICKMRILWEGSEWKSADTKLSYLVDFGLLLLFADMLIASKLYKLFESRRFPALRLAAALFSIAVSFLLPGKLSTETNGVVSFGIALLNVLLILTIFLLNSVAWRRRGVCLDQRYNERDCREAARVLISFVVAHLLARFLCLFLVNPMILLLIALLDPILFLHAILYRHKTISRFARRASTARWIAPPMETEDGVPFMMVPDQEAQFEDMLKTWRDVEQARQLDRQTRR